MLKHIQALGQALFLRVEAGFNILFGDRLNPLYCLGAISYWMFWIVVASGLYVYAFYETGVDTTYASVEAMTHGQWYAGGIMRSLHRYASEAMVLTMGLHLLSHFVFDRYRSFRAFSWITGVVVLWLAFVSGVNGYMLPWDRLAQFVTTATAEWFDALPVFRGSLVRNFILPEAITDRFFSLLSFLHIGIPLALLVVLWVHTQRVPRARTSPPRPLMLASFAALLVLSLLKPAVSQGPAELNSVSPALDFDWFLLPAYPLIYSLSPMTLWWLVGGATLLFVALPWLPPKRRDRGVSLQITVHPGNRTVAAREGDTVLEAGLRHSVPLPYDCRNGGCGMCKCTLLNGTLDHGVYQAGALSDGERAQGRFLACTATALTDVEIEYEEGAAGRESARLHTARVEALERLAPDVMRILLCLPEGERIAFEAGQFINIILDDGERRAYSFATPPAVSSQIELHVRLLPGGRFTTHVFNAMKAGDAVHFEGPLGASAIRDGAKPMIFVAGATGFAPVKSMLEYAFASGFKRPLLLYWGVRSKRDLYLPDLPRQWEREHSNFRYVPVLSEPASGDHWDGRTGLVHEAILADFPNLSGYEIYACGSMKMVEAARPAFIAHGLSEQSCFSDAFLPAATKA
ncbi:MAG: cytochrome b N-terminal domain-containing protein [Burkholderiales bacterium]|nr:cytochrome b N-terminal domain-containing protein [Burkholderiales bacterium]